MGAGVGLPEEVDPATHRPFHHHLVGQPGMDGNKVRSSGHALIAVHEIDETESPLEYVQDAPTSFCKSVLPLEGFRHIVLCKVQRAAGRNKPRRYSINHYEDSFARYVNNRLRATPKCVWGRPGTTLHLRRLWG